MRKRIIQATIIILCVALNMIGSMIARSFGLPVWLDSIGTIIAVIVIGPVTGALTGMGCTLFNWLVRSDSIWYILVSVAIAIVINKYYPKEKKNVFNIMAAASLTAAVVVCIATPITIIIYDGHIGNEWGDALVQMLSLNIDVPVLNIILGELFVEMPDKMFSLIMAFFIVEGCTYFSKRISRKKENTLEDDISQASKKISMLSILIISVFSVFFFQKDAFARDIVSDYETTLYADDSGLETTEINAIAQTPDGYLWAGSYSGLYRYEGTGFRRVNPDERINTVMQLMVDSSGRLWIGTNESGVACYDTITGDIEFYSTRDGLGSDSIRSLCEDDEKNIYVGTTGTLTVIDSLGDIMKPGPADLPGWEEITYVRSMSLSDDGIIGGVTNSGLLFFIKSNKVIATRQYDREGGVYYTAIGRTKNEKEFLVSTSGTTVERIKLDKSDLLIENRYSTKGITYLNSIMYDEREDGYFFCGENGLGFMEDSGEISILSRPGFDSSISDITIDYQDDIWFASNKQGVMKFARTPFENILDNTGIGEKVVNAVYMRDKELYVGTDDELIVLDAATHRRKNHSYLKHFDGVRIRHIMEDSSHNMWISTYGTDGLVRISADGSIDCYGENEGTLGGRFRLSMELHDGTILAASNMGLTYIKNGIVTDTIGEKEGLMTPQVLSMVEEDDGSILIATDGDGIYRIRDGEPVSHIGIHQGLSSLVVLKIVPAESGYFYVTSNAIFYDNGKRIRKLKHFPYTNNYDIFFAADGTAWVSSSAGIYVVNTDEMIEDKTDYNYALLNRTRGFYTTLTANAWNYTTDDDIYLCCTDGVRRVSSKEYDEFNSNYSIRINRVVADETEVRMEADGSFVVPEATRKLEIDVALLNYTLSNPLVKMWLDGVDETPVICHQDEMVPLTYTNLAYGSYRLRVQVFDGVSDEIAKDSSFPVIKNSQLYERPYFRIYLVCVVVIFVSLIVWMLTKVKSMSIINNQYEEIARAKEEAENANQAKSRFLANMSHEIRTPINAIMGMNELILRDNVSDEVRERATDIKIASNSLLSIVNDILDLSKIESGKMNLVAEKYDTAEFLSGVTSMIQVRCDEKNLEFKTYIDEKIPKRMYGDEVRLRQILINLLSNAVKYTPKGRVEFRIKKGETTVIPKGRIMLPGIDETTEENAEIGSKQVMLSFSVKDTGIGIRKEDMEKLFKPFERLDEKKNRNIQGTGLGLDIARQMIEMMGGELHCDSEYGKGSEFYFTIPQNVIKDKPVGHDWKAQVRHGEGGIDPSMPLFVAPDAKVLVVDDNDMNLAVAKGLLKRSMVQVSTATGGRECIKLMSENEYDLVFLDHMMPEMDGIETLHALRDMGIQTPVIALTANAVSGMKDTYIREGFDSFLAKPIDGLKLEKTMRDFISPSKMKKPDRTDRTDETMPLQTADGETPADAGLRGSPDRELPEWLTELDEIDTEEGLKNNADVDMYLSMLEIFYNSIEDKSAEIRSLFEAEDWQNYTIKVHALKSSARIIGAMSLNKWAQSLEDAGHENNIDKIKSETDDFLRSYEAFKSLIAPIAPELTEAEDDREEAPETMIEDAYNSLREFASAQDYDLTEMVLNSMKEYRLPEVHEEKMKQIEKLMYELRWDDINDTLNNTL